MRRLLLKFIGVTAALLAAVMLWIVATLPPAALLPSAPPPIDARLISGAYHIHSVRSDGSGTPDDIALAAARAGLQFIILTDHGDATRPPDTAYRHGVLCIDAVELSTAGGHVVALNLQVPSPFPLAGETADVIEDIRRIGGLAIAAHPDSSRPALRWRSTEGTVDGIEWFNVDTEWRAHGLGTLAASAARAWFRPAESVAALFRTPRASLERWDAALRTRPTFAIAALDAHARLGSEADGDAAPLALSLPSYETMFRTVAQTVRLAQPLTGDARRDAAVVLAGVAAGQSYSVVRAFVDAPRALEFRADEGSGRVDFGGTVTAEGPVMLHASVPPEHGARLVLFADGREVASGGSPLEYRAADAGAYRVEAHVGDFPMPWIVSNAIYIRRPTPHAVVTPSTVKTTSADQAASPLAPGTWAIEADPTSTGTVTPAGTGIALRYRLGPGAPAGQYVAMGSGAGGAAVIERIEFTATSARPLRVSVQVRTLNGSESRRWRRSVYVDDVPRPVSVALSAFVPVEAGSPRLSSAQVQSVLFVIDTVNARPGDSGEVVFRDVRVVTKRSP